MKGRGIKSYLNFKYTWKTGCRVAFHPWVNEEEKQRLFLQLAIVG